MKQHWEKLSAKLDAMTLRERVFILAAMVVAVVSLANMFLFEPLLLRSKSLHTQLQQQQLAITQTQSGISSIEQENSPNSASPQRQRINQLKQELAKGNAFLQGNRENLVQPEKMAEHLRRLLGRNSNLQLVAMNNLPVTPLLEKPVPEKNAQANSDNNREPAGGNKNQVYKHGVKLVLRGSYPELQNYLQTLESLPQQMYWAQAEMRLVKYPVTELTLVLYTLGLDKTWLQI